MFSTPRRPRTRLLSRRREANLCIAAGSSRAEEAGPPLVRLDLGLDHRLPPFVTPVSGGTPCSAPTRPRSERPAASPSRDARRGTPEAGPDIRRHQVRGCTGLRQRRPRVGRVREYRIRPPGARWPSSTKSTIQSGPDRADPTAAHPRGTRPEPGVGADEHDQLLPAENRRPPAPRRPCAPARVRVVDEAGASRTPFVLRFRAPTGSCGEAAVEVGSARQGRRPVAGAAGPALIDGEPTALEAEFDTGGTFTSCAGRPGPPILPRPPDREVHR